MIDKNEVPSPMTHGDVQQAVVEAMNREFAGLTHGTAEFADKLNQIMEDGLRVVVRGSTFIAHFDKTSEVELLARR